VGGIGSIMQYHTKGWFNNTSVNALAAIAIGAMLIFSVSGMKAFADVVQNDIDSDAAGTVTITEGATTTVGYRIHATAGDTGDTTGRDGQTCNPERAAVTIELDLPSGVSASPSSLTFDSCEEYQYVDFTSSTSGAYTVRVKDAGAAYNESPATFTLAVEGEEEVPPEEEEPPTPSDTTPPVITANIQGTQGSNGWYTSTVTVSWTVEENESLNSLQTSGCDETTISTDTAGTDITCEATSDGGSDSKTVTIKLDATKPEITVNSEISNGQEFYFGDVPSEPTCDATDATSGINSDGCQVSGYGTTVGSYTLKFTAKDNAGNTQTQEIGYKVLPWTIKGFYQPVDMNGVNNIVKAGSTVPLKFEVFKGSTELTDISVRDTVAQKKVTCDTGATVDEIEQYTTTGQTTLRYDTSSGQFIDNWKSPTTKNVCYQVTMTFDDGSSVAALFRTK
jgi:hypothetical protein